MIMADNKAIVIEGDLVSLLGEFTSVCRKLREALTAVENENYADRTINFCVTLSRKTPEELEKEAKENETDDTKSVN